MRCVLLLGDAGIRVGCGLVWSACAGAWDDEPLTLLLAELTPSGDAEAFAALVADYSRMHRAMAALPGDKQGFRAPLTLLRWPESLPYNSVQAMAAGGDTDADLCRALFDRDTASRTAQQGLRADAAAALFAALTAKPEGALANLLADMEAHLQAGEDVRVLLCGALHESTGAAGVAALAQLVRSRLAPWQEKASLAAALLLPCTGMDEKDDAAARAALASGAYDMLDAAYMLGLAADQRTPAEGKAHLTEWLAARCAWDFFHRDTPPVGLFTWQTAPGRLGWSCFGSESDAARRAFGGFAQAAAGFKAVLAPAIRQGVAEPKWLRDRLLKWYAAYFGSVRRMDESARSALLTQLNALSRLTDGYLAWLASLLDSLPPALRQTDALTLACRAAEENYRQLLEASGQLTALRQDAEISGMSQEKAVHRYDMADTENERLQQYMQQLEQRCQALREKQDALDSRIGGALALKLRRNVCAAQQAESDKLHGQAAEALSRIDRAEQVAAPKEQHLITAARTKMRRLERYMAQVDAQLEKARQDVTQAAAPEQRSQPPQLDGENHLPQTDLFAADALAFFVSLPVEGAGKRQAAQVEDAWGRLLPGSAAPLSQLLAALDGSGASAEEPLAAFLNDLMKGVG